MKHAWERLTLMDFASEDDDGHISAWHWVGAAIVMMGLLLVMDIGTKVGF